MSKNKKKRKNTNQNYTGKPSFFSKRLPLWMAPVLGAMITLLFFGGISLLVTEEIPWAALGIAFLIGAFAGGILWLKKR